MVIDFLIGLLVSFERGYANIYCLFVVWWWCSCS